MEELMPIIADHCSEDGSGRYSHKIECDWPDDCYVQWGSCGVVLCETPYKTAFFEAFPKEPETFIRGEGKTISEAEKNAFDKLQKYLLCNNHEFERGGYTSGAGVCKKCGMFSSTAFEYPTTKCYWCGKPTNFYVDNQRRYWCEEHSLRANEIFKNYNSYFSISRILTKEFFKLIK